MFEFFFACTRTCFACACAQVLICRRLDLSISITLFVTELEFLEFTHRTYRLYFFNLEDLSRFHWRSKFSKKGVKKRAKLSLKCQVYAKKLYYTLIMTLMNSIFDMFNHLIYECVIFYTN